ncbi:MULTISPECIES: biofilm-dependent modulation protein [Tenebrionibacter/Tenebrionicola group]|jgi:hypothetical protein|uniref:Biofilm-dependent modulation protein n=2 Tax=Tenebrionibacter/Tenebrionicola group TaxID=2969848 RepID=A0A8K0XWN3_9ENTR|nr:MULTISPECIES: biofilm-dependent modulation protein [Tenebrionibacter/Tenebrionicola group]MBK4714723.1 biofilm-dependent modulation protein [Tenebrionibacter intestinalis]MBV4413880.1 biofilm-dependent modulation protein [Tenebrionicola larvae]MBV5095195.1 biofilm-dependent modulation protein [Tenebrionicola larvae]
MHTYFPAESNTHSVHPVLIEAIKQGLRAKNGSVTQGDVLMELIKWVEASDNAILSDIYQQTIYYIVEGRDEPQAR